jgi:UDP-glucose 4-epimerase
MKEKETLLIPNVLRAVRQGPAHPLNVFGTDYPTPDGTCIRDYVHVMDLCSAHLLAMRYLERGGKSDVFNLGNGKGYSVKQVIGAAEKYLKLKVPVKTLPRRPGDPSRIIASTAKARRVLRWRPRYNLARIFDTAWRWDRRKAGLRASGWNY